MINPIKKLYEWWRKKRADKLSRELELARERRRHEQFTSIVRDAHEAVFGPESSIDRFGATVADADTVGPKPEEPVDVPPCGYAYIAGRVVGGKIKWFNRDTGELTAVEDPSELLKGR